MLNQAFNDKLCSHTWFDLRLRHIVYNVGADRKRQVVGKYHYADADLRQCSGYKVYPDKNARLGYMHSFSMTENFIILPTTGYLNNPCFYGTYFKRLVHSIGFTHLSSNKHIRRLCRSWLLAGLVFNLL